MNETLANDYLADALSSFRAYRKLAEKAIAQVKDEELFVTLDEESNSIAVIMKHMAGNMISRWTDFFNSDGEKPDRNRDMEFVIEPQTSKVELLAYWERGWQCVFGALEPLQSEDFEKRVLIRGEEHKIVQAINRQMAHYAYHVGQIVFLAKHFRSTEWKSLSIPRNRSAEFNAFLTANPRVADREKQFDAIVNFASEAERETGRFQGLRTAVYYVDDIEKAKSWYSSALGIEPYFAEPFYVGFNVGGYELGLHPDEGKPKGEGQVAYWGVEDAATAFKRLLELGATKHEDVQDVGGGIKVATVKDPFGNVLGVIENPGFGK